MRKIIPLALTALTLLAACNEDTNNLHIQANTSLPLGTMTVSTEKLLSLANIDDQIKPNDENVVQFTMSNENQLLDNTNFNEILNIPNQQFNISIPTTTIPKPPGTPAFIPIPIPITEKVDFTGLTDEIIKKLILKDGRVSIQNKGTSDFSKLTITIPQIKKNNVPIILTSGTNIILDDTYTIEPTNNSIDIVLTGQIPSTTTSIDLDVKIDIDEIQSAQGFFGRKETDELNTDLSIDKGEFDIFLKNTDFIYFADPQINVTVKNSYNVPIMAKLTKIAVNGIPIQFKTGLNSDRFLITGEGKSNLKINNSRTVSGSGLSDAITKDFNSIAITVETIVNPTADDLLDTSYTPPTDNEINNTDTATAIYDIDIPFDVTIKNLTITDKTDVDLSSLLPEEHQYNEIAFAISGTNSLPLDITVNTYITHNDLPDGTKIQLFDDGFNIGSKPDKLDPFVIDKTVPIIKKVNAQTITQLLKAKALFFELTSSTSGAAEKEDPSTAKPVKLYMDSELMLNITLGADANISLN